MQLKKMQEAALEARKEDHRILKEQVDALSDPAAGEKALIEELGVVPKGMIRVEYED